MELHVNLMNFVVLMAQNALMKLRSVIIGMIVGKEIIPMNKIANFLLVMKGNFVVQMLFVFLLDGNATDILIAPIQAMKQIAVS